jgi:NitT/TauT family transport system substrate-binding protein
VFGEKAHALMPILEKWVQPKPTFDMVKASANYMDSQGRLLVNDIYAQVAWYEREGLVDKSVNAKDLLDLSFVQGHFGVPR